MSDKTELDLDAERASFEAEGTKLHGWGESDYRREQIGWQKLGDYMWLDQRHAFALWLAARRATIQPTAAEPVQTIVSYRPDTSKRKPCSYMKADGTCEKCRGSRYCVSPPEYEMVPVYRTASVAPADAVRDARDLALRQALEDIANPIAAMQREVPEGYSFNGHVAIQMANDPEWYKRRAAEALKSNQKEPAK